MQNFPWFTVPQPGQVHPWGWVSGLGAPHSIQNFPVFPLWPQAQSQVPAGSGFLAPQAMQNFPVLPFWPQLQSQTLGAAAPGANPLG